MFSPNSPPTPIHPRTTFRGAPRSSAIHSHSSYVILYKTAGVVSIAPRFRGVDRRAVSGVSMPNRHDIAIIRGVIPVASTRFSRITVVGKRIEATQ